MGIQRLPRAVSAGIVSTSSVQSQVSVLKELIENAIDAIEANNTGDDSVAKSGQIYIEIDKDSAGLDYLLVKDNGTGIQKGDRNILCMNCTTSKLTSMDQLSNGVSTCGFRGEALNFIARLSKSLNISTKTKDDVTMESWSVNNSGLPNSDFKSAPGIVGTTIKITGLFKATPVRYKYLKEKKTFFLKQLESIIEEYALIHENIRFQIRYVKFMQNGRVVNGECKSYPIKISRLQFIYEVLNIRKKNWLFNSNFSFAVMDLQTHSNFIVNVSLVMPRMRAQDVPIMRKNALKVLSINNRLLDLSLKFGKAISTKINEAYTHNMLLPPPVWFLSMNIPLPKVDVNIEPGKSDILVHNEQLLYDVFKEELTKVIIEEHKLNNDKIEIENDIAEPSVKNDSKLEKNDTTTTTSENVLFVAQDEILISDDEDFISELDSTLKEMKDRYLDNNMDKGLENKNLVADDRNEKTKECLTKNDSKHINGFNLHNEVNTDSHDNDNSNDLCESIDAAINANDDANNHDDQFDPDNEWSRTILDTTGISSELEIPSSQKEVDGKVSESVDSVSLTVSNPWTITKLSSEIKSHLNDDPSNLNTSTTITSSPNPTAPSSKQTKLHPDHTTKQQSSKKSKQLAVTSYLTYHIDSPEKNKTNNEIKLPRITETSQNTNGDKLDVTFAFTLRGTKRKSQLIEDERWIKRSGIPSFILLENVRALYERISYDVEDETPELNEEGIYQLK